MRRRKFISLLGGAVAWPLDARAQQNEQMRRLGALQGGLESDAEFSIWKTAFVQGLRELGWVEARNLLID